MSGIDPNERVTQAEVIQLFTEELGYRNLGNLQHHTDNRNIREADLEAFLAESGYNPDQISKALLQLKQESSHPRRNLYHNNQAVYRLLRAGHEVKLAAGEHNQQVHYINWAHVKANHFAIAEEVSLRGETNRRPDLVLYLNGIAVAVIELKRASVDVAEGVTQLCSNQRDDHHAGFFTTVQFCFAGNKTQGLHYGTIETQAKHYLQWKEDPADNRRDKLSKYLLKMCNKERLLELIRDFVLFDGGKKKVPRAHQYLGIKAAQTRIKRNQGGIIWHSQGSGKSIVMVLLARWILANVPGSRVAVITDRVELDRQIEMVFTNAKEKIARVDSGRELLRKLQDSRPSMMCSLIHKFGRGTGATLNEFVRGLEEKPIKVHGNVFVFVDECHRTQSGKFHKVMRATLDKAIFIGFTGTPLLKEDASATRKVFGKVIHSYKYAEAVEDGVVLDLIYESREVAQELGSHARIDQWFDSVAKKLSPWQKRALQDHWGTMQKVLSSKGRKGSVVADILCDFKTRPRLNAGSQETQGTAMLVARSRYDACCYYELFQDTFLRGKVGLAISYSPQSKAVTYEDHGDNQKTQLHHIHTVYTQILKERGLTKPEDYEEAIKKEFKETPDKMKLLVVVNKLLTGFDAPSCTYLYIDRPMKDHNLFQAVCRTNRLADPTKRNGYIVDYMELFQQVENAIRVYSSELAKDADEDESDNQIYLKARLENGRIRLDEALDQLNQLCEGVEAPAGDQEYIRYFVGNTEIPEAVQATAPRRYTFYKKVAIFIRAYANIADDLPGAGYDGDAIKMLQRETRDKTRLRDIIRLAAQETMNLKAYEADMRHLIDTYIKASDAEPITSFEETPLLELFALAGVEETEENLRKQYGVNQQTTAEMITGNVRAHIVKEHLNDPGFYEKMSQILNEIITDLKAKKSDYKEFLKRVEALTEMLKQGKSDDMPEQLKTKGQRAIYNILEKLFSEDAAASDDGPDSDADGSAENPLADLALEVDVAVAKAAADAWRGNKAKENAILRAIYVVLGEDEAKTREVFKLINRLKDHY